MREGSFYIGMRTRLKFLPERQRNYLSKISLRCSSSEIAQILSVSPRTYRDWLREKYTLPLWVAEILSRKFSIILPENKQMLIQRWRDTMKIAGKIGGVARFHKYGAPGTREGRIKGGMKALEVCRHRGLIAPVKLFREPDHSENLAELLGILLGDGGLSKSRATITLNSVRDSKYIHFVSDLLESLFGEKPKIRKRTDCKATSVYLDGVNLLKYLVKTGLVTGNKIQHQVGVPGWILDRRIFKVACLRGLMDTDGAALEIKRKDRKRGPNYFCLNFSNRSRPLADFVFGSLEELGIKPYRPKIANGNVWVYNKAGFERYFEVVGTHNPRNLIWRRRIVDNST